MIEEFVKIATIEELEEIMAQNCMVDMYKYSVAREEYDQRNSRSVTKRS